jgi:hypothetical protein
MRAPFRRIFLAFAVAGILAMSLAGIASAHVVSKTITTDNGGAAVYDPVLGFTGQISFQSGEGAIHLSDFLCENRRDAGGSFSSVGGNYTLILSVGGSPVSTTSYTIAGGFDCTDGNTQSVFPINLTVPASVGDYVVDYSLVLAGFNAGNFTNDNSILNRIEEQNDGHANSPSVPPPQGPPNVPEAPLSVLLVLTGGLGAAWFVSRKMRPSLPTATA